MQFRLLLCALFLAVSAPAGASAKAPVHRTPPAVHRAKPHRPAPSEARTRLGTARARAETTAAREPNDPRWASSWGLRALGAPAIWRWGQGSPRIVVAVVDTGIDASQPDLAGALVAGWNALDGSSNTADDVGHGTAVAGVIAARANNRLGSSGYCAQCSVMPVKVVDATGRGSSSMLAAGIEWAATHGASIINVSLVLSARDPAVSAAVADALARGVLVVASAGNDGGTAPNYPAAEPGVISVAATDASAGLYPWSARGDWVSVSAPGCNEATSLAGGFGEFCGTSSASAAVSGLLALALSDSNAPATALCAALLATAAHGGPVPRVEAEPLIRAVLRTHTLF
jgi:subtilisin family serine protease